MCQLKVLKMKRFLNWLILMFKNDFFKAIYCQLIYESLIMISQYILTLKLIALYDFTMHKNY